MRGSSESSPSEGPTTGAHLHSEDTGQTLAGRRRGELDQRSCRGAAASHSFAHLSLRTATLLGRNGQRCESNGTRVSSAKEGRHRRLVLRAFLDQVGDAIAGFAGGKLWSVVNL